MPLRLLNHTDFRPIDPLENKVPVTEGTPTVLAQVAGALLIYSTMNKAILNTPAVSRKKNIVRKTDNFDVNGVMDFVRFRLSGMNITAFRKMKKAPENVLFSRAYGGRNRTRTCDPIDVNDVLYQLSHATM